jgi:succinate dehydrogenase / fumarate reductase cytochrome b subunit
MERSVKDVREASMVAHTSDGKLVRRPLSPHLQIYKPQITTVLSIAHRITGVALAVGTLLLVWWLAAAATSAASFATVQGFVGSPIGLLLLFGWTFALFFHLVNGIRHLLWDAGYGYELPSVHSGGWATVIATVVLTVLTWLVGIIVI